MKKDYPFLHHARIAACIAVIIIHTVSSNVASLRTVSISEWWVDNIIDSSVVWAVPLFVMISGALLLDLKRKENIATFYRKRFLSVGLPALFWISAYYLFFNYFIGISYSPISFIKHILLEQPFENLYFLFIIMELYIITPFLKAILSSLSKRQGIYLSVLFLFIGLFWHYQRFIGTMFIPYLGYYILGLYARDVTSILKYRRILILSFFLNAAAISIGTYLFASHTIYNYNDDFFFYRHTNIFVMLLTITMFFLFRSFDHYIVTRRNIYALIKNISTATLGIYILHWPIRLILFYVLFHTKEYIYPVSLTMQLGVFILLFAASFIITKIFQQLSYLKLLV
jgi:surface polysaccharide O-acyltransferase-like enzyme